MTLALNYHADLNRKCLRGLYLWLNKTLHKLFILDLVLFGVRYINHFRLFNAKKKLDSNYTRMLRAILNKSWRQHPTMQYLYGHLPPITKTIKIRRTRHAGHCWRSRDELISDVLQWTPSHGQVKHFNFFVFNPEDVISFIYFFNASSGNEWSFYIELEYESGPPPA